MTFFGLHLSQLDAFASFATILHHSYPLTWNLEQLRHPLVGLGRWIGIAAPGSEVQKAQGITDSGASQTIGVGWCFKGNGNSIPALCQYHQSVYKGGLKATTLDSSWQKAIVWRHLGMFALKMPWTG